MLSSTVNRLKKQFRKLNKIELSIEQQLLSNGKILSELNTTKSSISSLDEVEFKVFSQWGDDGIIQWLVHHLDIPNHSFIEFGVSNYRESNTRFLLMNNNWSGLVMDGSESNVEQIKSSEYYWQYELTAKTAFIDRDNVNQLIASAGFDADLGLLHIDIDGNDYWVWEAITAVTPVILILEYNSVFGLERAITTPYKADFYRTLSHHSNLYYGASLKALQQLSHKKGYTFVGSNSAGNNAYFVRNDKLNQTVKECSLESGYRLSKFRESRDENGQLTYINGADRLE